MVVSTLGGGFANEEAGEFTSRTLPTRTFCWSDSETPDFWTMSLFLIPIDSKEGALADAEACAFAVSEGVPVDMFAWALLARDLA